MHSPIEADRQSDASEGPTCRICRQGAEVRELGDLIHPCRCTGSLHDVHRVCLDTWRKTGSSSNASLQCTVCSQRYVLDLNWTTEWRAIVFGYCRTFLWSLLILAVFGCSQLCIGSLCERWGTAPYGWVNWHREGYDSQILPSFAYLTVKFVLGELYTWVFWGFDDPIGLLYRRLDYPWMPEALEAEAAFFTSLGFIYAYLAVQQVNHRVGQRPLLVHVRAALKALLAGTILTAFWILLAKVASKHSLLKTFLVGLTVAGTFSLSVFWWMSFHLSCVLVVSIAWDSLVTFCFGKPSWQVGEGLIERLLQLLKICRIVLFGPFCFLLLGHFDHISYLWLLSVSGSSLLQKSAVTVPPRFPSEKEFEWFRLQGIATAYAVWGIYFFILLALVTPLTRVYKRGRSRMASHYSVRDLGGIRPSQTEPRTQTQSWIQREVREIHRTAPTEVVRQRAPLTGGEGSPQSAIVQEVFSASRPFLNRPSASPFRASLYPEGERVRPTPPSAPSFESNYSQSERLISRLCASDKNIPYPSYPAYFPP